MDSMGILGQALECSVCLEQLGTSSRVLPCQHTFCHTCLDDISKSRKELRCPECRTLVTTPLEELPTNILLMRILEGMKNMPGTSASLLMPVSTPSKQSSVPDANSLNYPKAVVSRDFNDPLRPTRSNSISVSAVSDFGSCQSKESRYSVSQAGTAPSSTVTQSRIPYRSPLSFMNPLSSSPSATSCEQQTHSSPVPSRYMDNDIYGAVFDPNFSGPNQLLNRKPTDTCSSTPRKTNEIARFPEMMKSESSDEVPELVPKKVAVALFSYQKKESRDLSFQKDDVIIIHKQIDQNWYQGALNGSYGFVPASYVQVEESPQCKALYNFQQDPQNDKCLTFKKGDVIDVLRRLDENWIEGKLNDEVGIVPICFVLLNDAAKKLLKDDRNEPLVTLSGQDTRSPSGLKTATSSNMSRTSVCETSQVLVPLERSTPPIPTKEKTYDYIHICTFPYDARKADELRLSKGNIYYVIEKFHDGWYKGRSLADGSEGVFPGNYVKPLRSVSSASTSSNNTSHIANHLASLKAENSVSRPPALSPRTMTASLTSTSKGSTSGLFQTSNPQKVCSKIISTLPTSTNNDLRKIMPAKPPRTSEKPDIPRAMPLVKERFRCIVPYPASSPVELGLQVGEIVYVHGKLNEGWYKGTLQKSGQVGLFPANFVEPC